MEGWWGDTEGFSRTPNKYWITSFLVGPNEMKFLGVYSWLAPSVTSLDLSPATLPPHHPAPF